MPNLYSSRPLSNWSKVVVHRCHGCGQDFRSEHMAAFHECDKRSDDVTPELRLAGFVDERGEIVSTKLDARRREYTELAGLDLVFTMHARAFKSLVADAEVTLRHGTPHEQGELLAKLVNILKEAQ